MTQSDHKIVEILIVEDNESDVDLIREAFNEAKLQINFSVAFDGIEAMEILRTRNLGNLPDIILLDLNLPRRSGQELLEEIKSDPTLKLLPVVILTSSNANEDITSSYCMHANCYIIKPFDFEQLVKIVKLISEFWLTIVKLPPQQSCT